MNAELVKHIELLVGSIGVILGVFFASFILITKKKQSRANLFLSIYLFAFSFRIGKSLFHNYFEIDATLRTFFLTMLLCVGPSIWLYTFHLVKSEVEKKNSDYFHFLPFIIIASICWLIPNDGSPIFGIFYNFLTAHIFCYTLFSLLWFKAQKITFSDKKRSKIVHWLNCFLSINLLFITLYFLISQLIISFYIGLSFLFSMVVISLSFFGLKNPSLFMTFEEKYKHSNIDKENAFLLMERLKALMQNEKPYLDPSLNQSELSAKLNVSTKELSQVINQTESLNYSQFISRYRVEEVQHLLKDPSYSKMTIAAVAYDCGFNSISTFNAAFKKHARLTAIEYRKSLETN